jgi:hypothetical protein
MSEALQFIQFVATGPDWNQFGITVGYEGNGPSNGKPTLYKMTIAPYPFDGSINLRHDQIVKIFGTNRWVIKANWISTTLLAKKLSNLLQICKRVNNMKAFL